MFPNKISEKIIQFVTPFYECYLQIAHFNGFSKYYYVVDFNQTAAVVCLNNKNEVLITKQYRFLINSISFEVSGGGVNDDEDFLIAATRELFEETGYHAKNLIPLCKFMPGLDNVKNLTHVFLCTNYTLVNRFNTSPNEILSCEWIHIDECLKLISEYKILDGTSIIAIALAKQYIHKISIV
jgi:ADP-ribose pyrophosphatase